MRLTRVRVIGIAAAVVAVAAVAWCSRPSPIAVDVAATSRRRLEAVVNADGRTRVRERYAVVAPVAGRVVRLTLVEGATVRAGDVVARIEPLPLDPATLSQARARVDAASALAQAAAGEVRVANDALLQRRRELSRALRLAEAGGVAPRVVEECQLALSESEAAARSAAERARAAAADVRQARAAIAGQEPGSAASPVLVRSPAAGRVLRIAERSERVVAAGTPLIEIGEPSSLEIVVDVLSSDGAAIHSGDVVRLSGWGTEGTGEADHPLGGRVRDVEPSAFTRLSALGVEEQRVNVLIEPEGTVPFVGDGFRVEASIVVWATPEAVAVPVGALLRPDDPAKGEWAAFVVRSGRAERRTLRVGHVAGSLVEILGGVEPGEEVIVFPSDQVVHGARVAPRRST